MTSMNRRGTHTSLTVAVTVGLLAVDLFATCGGGGGGGTGGMGSGMGNQNVYPVPWKNAKLGDPIDPAGLALYWFPASQNELEKSSLRNSRLLALSAAQCVSLGVADVRSPLGLKFAADVQPPVAVLADGGGTIIGKAVGNADGKLKVDQVEKLLGTELKARETAVKGALKDAKDKAKTDKDAAIALYKSVVDRRCMFASQAKDAVKELKKLGVTDLPQIAEGPVMDPVKGDAIEKALRDGVMAEGMEKYTEAEKFYAQARRLDPADPAPLRYLGELYRHQFGDWDKARQMFETILQMPADPLSRAVAMHGIGKMTIHDGEFKKGLGLMEDSIREFPLPLTYRNLAVYWHSEGDRAKADYYTQQALALDPQEPFNLIFAAAFMAGGPNTEAALKVARDNEALLCASYNLAAIYAQTGDTRKALDLLQRHFFVYERYDAVRSKEMMEARVDIVFASLMKEPEFMKMTAGADGKLDMRK
jgi:tetratricopeptide (TPR) repeat protein